MSNNFTQPQNRKLAVHMHLHYTDLLPVMLPYLNRIPFPYDLYVTITDAKEKEAVGQDCANNIPSARVAVLTVENKGRDVKPLYTDLGTTLLQYDYICHIHGKKSVFNNGATTGWLEHLLDSLMGSAATVEAIFHQFEHSPSAGMIYPANFNKMPYWAHNWLSNRGQAGRLAQLLHIRQLPHSYFSFPVGNMFWAKVDAIRPLLTLGLKDTDYPPEKGQLDGEIMHALERMTTVVARDRGFKNFVLEKKEDEIKITDDSAGIDYTGYYSNSLEGLQQAIDDPAIKLVSFDIFDTLICRSLPDPEDLFVLMQEEFEEISGQKADFKMIRTEADASLRPGLPAGRDVTLDAIYERIGERLQLEPAAMEQLKDLELSYESRLLGRRDSVIRMMDHAYSSGKRVILTSDMYLSRQQIVSILEGLNIRNYHECYISSSEGKRKDARNLFPHILDKEGVPATGMLHIGDNEHSDIQIPGDLLIRTFHIMRPKELFARTKWGGRMSRNQKEPLSLYSKISLALSMNKIFDHPFPGGKSLVNGELSLFGYHYFGPILLSFVKWIADTAVKDKVERLYFLSRDGEILFKIYQLLERFSDTPLPEGQYLEVSRRSIGIPFIANEQQLDTILSVNFAQGPLCKYIDMRMGIDLKEHREIELQKFGFNTTEDQVSIPRDLEKIKPLAHFLLHRFQVYFIAQKENALGYLNSHDFFDDRSKAIVDIGYSGTMQRMLNQVAHQPIHGYYMVTYDTIDTFIGRHGVRTSALFGDKVDRSGKQIPIDRYSLFYEMILSSVKGSVKRYDTKKSRYAPIHEKVSVDERQKLEKLPVIHKGITDFCKDLLTRMNGPRLIRWDEHAILQAPFISFLENPMQADVDMLSGYSLDDEFCGNGIVYWVPRKEEREQKVHTELSYLWKSRVSGFNPVGREAYFDKGGEEETGFVASGQQDHTRQEEEIISWYHRQYEVLPRWYKIFGQIFKILKGKKRVCVVLKDVGYQSSFGTKVEELKAWYDKEYEILPLWYKRFGHIVQVFMGRKRLKDLL